MANHSRRNFPMSKVAKSQQQKFFRICSDDYKNKLTGKVKMSLADFNDITMILCLLHFDDYYTYVICRFFDTLDSSVAEIKSSLDDAFDLDTYMPICDELLKKFVDGIKSKRLKPIYEEILFPSYV